MTHIEYLDHILENVRSWYYKLVLPKMKDEYQYHYYLIVLYSDEPPQMKLFEYKAIKGEDFDSKKPPIVEINVYGFKHAEMTIVYFAMNEKYNWDLIYCVKEVIKKYYHGMIDSRQEGIEECKKKYLNQPQSL